jgi:hypothetical protein
MTEIRIDNTGEGTWWLYGKNESWKDYVGCENFDEQVVLIGNRDYSGCTEAEWYQNAKRILDNIDCYDEYPDDVSEEVNAKLKELYDKCRCTKDIIIDVLRLLYPEDTFEEGTIRGYCQGEWQEYIVMGNVDTDLLEAFYFGKIADIQVESDEDSFGDVITHDELWKAEREGLKEYMRQRYDISKDEEIRILQADGYRQVVNWKEVC